MSAAYIRIVLQKGMDVGVKANKDVNVNATANANIKGLFVNLN